MNAEEKLLSAKLLDQAYRGQRISIYASLLVSALIVLALWGSVAHGMLLAWLALNVMIQLRHSFYLRSYMQIKTGVSIEVEKWERVFVTGAVVAGLGWGSTVFFFASSPFDPVTVLVIFIIAGVTAFGSVSMAAVPAAVSLFLIGALFPLAIWLFSFNDWMFTVMSLIVAAYLAAMMFLSRQIYSLIRSQLSSASQNKVLTQIAHESDQRMSRFFASAPGFFYTAHMSPDGVASMPFVSSGIVDLIGIPAERVAHSLAPLLDLIHPEDAPRLMEARHESLTNLTELHVEFRINHPKKGERWIELRSQPLRDQKIGTILHGYMNDVTERKSSDDILQRRETEFRALAENAPDPIYRYDRNCRRVYVNPAVAKLTGVPLEKMLGKSPNEFVPVPTVDSDKVQRCIQRVLDTGMPGELEVAIKAADGRDVIVHNNLVPEFNNSGKVESVLCIGRDITARKQMEEILQRSEHEYRTLAENFPDGIMRLDREFRVCYVNRNLEAALNMPASYLLGKVPTEIFADGLFDDLAEVAKSVVKERKAGEYHLTLPDGNGSERYHHLRITPELDERGEINGILFIGRDMTERVRMEQALAARETEYRTLAANLPVAVIRYDTEQRRTYINPAAEKMLHGNTAELLGQVPGGGGVPASAQMIAMYRGKMAEVMASGEACEFEFVLDALAAAEQKQYAVRMTPEYDRNVQITGVLAIWFDITERKRVEAALVERERAFGSLAGNIPDNIARLDTAGRYLYVNPTHERTLGMRAADLVGRSLPDSHEKVKAGVAQVVASGRAIHAVRQPVLVDGVEQLHDVSLVPEFDESGQVISVLGIGRDMTDIYRMQETIAAREQEFRSLAESSPDSIIRYDRDGRILYLNTPLVRELGLGSADEVIGKRPSVAWPDGRFDAIEQAAVRAVETGEMQVIEMVSPGQNGKQNYSMISVVPERDTNGNVIGTIAFGRNITEIKQAAAQLEQERATLRTFFAAMPSLAWMKDAEGRYLASNPLFEQLYGHTENEILGKTDFDFVDAELAMFFREKDKVAEEAGKPCVNEEWVTFASDGRRALLETVKAPVFDAAGKVIGVIGVAHDITERKRMQEALRESEQLMRTVVDATPDWIFIKDREHRYRLVNQGYADALHLAPEDFIGKTDLDLGFPEELVKGNPEKGIRGFWADDRLVLGSNETQVFPDDPATIDGVVHTFHTIKVPLRGADGKAWGVLAFARDISERKRMEEQLRSTADFQQTLLKGIRDVGIQMMVFESGRVVYANDTGFTAQLGYSAEEMAAHPPFIDMVHPDDRALVMDRNRRRLAGEPVPPTYEIGVLMGDGSRREIDLAVSIIPDTEPVRLIAIARDITERKQAQEKMAMLSHALDQADPAFLLEDGRVVYANKSTCRVLGYSEEEIIGMDVRDIDPHVSPEQAMELEKSLAERGFYHFESRHKTRDGRTFPVEVSLTSLNYDGKRQMLSLARDITQRKQLEDALKEKFARIVELNNQLEVTARDLEDQTVELEAQTVELEASQEQIKLTEAWYRGIVRSAPDGMVVVNEKGDISLVNAHLETMFGYEEGELLGHPMEVLLPPDVREAHVAKRMAFFASGATGRPMDSILNGLRACRKDGTEFPVDVSLSRLPDAGGKSGVICAAIRDVTERKRIENALATREQEFRMLAENSPDTISRYNRECRRIYANSTFGAMVEGGVAALLGKTPTEYPGGVNADIYETKIIEVLATGEACEFELKWPDKDDREVCTHVRIAAEFNASGEVVSALAVGRDITELNEHRKRVYQMAFYDSLTSLPNRALFNDRLRQMITDASWHSHHAGVMLLDLDRFKAVNDTLGHPAGDELLREAAARLTYCVRGYDTVARLGGDEFAILLPEIRSGDDLGRVSNKILEAFGEPFLLEGKEVFVSCSIGIAVYPEDSEDGDDLLKQADSAMYFAKRSGRNNFRFYSKDLTVTSNERLMLEGDLRRGFGRGELVLYFQPKIALADGALIGSEALLRWLHPERGMIPPDKFISIAEDCGLIVEIGEWVLRQGCRVACEWNAPGKALHKVAINLSARQFQSANLVKTVRSVLEETGCYPEWIELEITESLLLDEDGQVLEMLEAFRDMGITIAIDDFGTGYSSLSYLARFPIDTLKIDRSFTSKVTGSGHHAELVKAIISIAHSLQQKVVAEGVETLEQAAILQAYGCHIAQGYLYSKPIPKIAFEALPRSFG